ncbi:MAG: FAD-dependent monooxygenase [Pseudomonadota bacterium]
MGLTLAGESARQLWGVMDVLAVTDFPDIRLKCAVQSAAHGSLLIIPREGGHLVRLYIELDSLHGSERAGDRGVDSAHLTRRAQAILSPYRFEVKAVAWCSAYEVGQRVCERFDDIAPAERGARSPRVFIAGDACHTHSPKAGQGMNVSMADAFNLGWKLAAVVRGHAGSALLDTYTAERQAKAQELIDFDRDMARLFSTRNAGTEATARFQAYFEQHGRYTAGVATCYAASCIVGNVDHQSLATGLPVGMRFHSAPVIRLADAKPMQLAESLPADGRWRVIAFASESDDGTAHGQIAQVCATLADTVLPGLAGSAGTNPTALIDVLAVFQQHHRTLDIHALPELLRPRVGRLGLINYENVFCADHRPGEDIYTRRGIDPQRGALVLVRPDHTVSWVLPLADAAAMSPFLGGVFTRTGT